MDRLLYILLFFVSFGPAFLAKKQNYEETELEFKLLFQKTCIPSLTLDLLTSPERDLP